jgi:hypothetical protein
MLHELTLIAVPIPMAPTVAADVISFINLLCFIVVCFPYLKIEKIKNRRQLETAIYFKLAN